MILSRVSVALSVVLPLVFFVRENPITLPFLSISGWPKAML